jgi:hypothetical protein
MSLGIIWLSMLGIGTQVEDQVEDRCYLPSLESAQARVGCFGKGQPVMVTVA